MGNKNKNPLKNLMLAKILSEIVDELKKSFSKKLHKVFLYGSYAKGEATSESDMDIFVLVNVTDVDSRKYLNKLVKVGVDISIKHNIVPMIIPENSNEFYDNIDVIPLFRNIKREGVLLYEA
ncbi:MAG: nucleotidyltransferase domain-containing protein [Acidobacteria bacterium]|nr:nucleotidyltransferase domain-containing protein [Acidobacteriota bacterium]MBU4306665.1 nucleotidyltransferase domain-containing protein [Acidobacteriota bacterium]MBU4405707.1 nucleotidyltransferase domain-containing protein [Acidobacteriota bacterium]MCG2811363.1 nucleotidyltransferase domain-containing protein [Candidatus Aminicenantes bacterium]